MFVSSIVSTQLIRSLALFLACFLCVLLCCVMLCCRNDHKGRIGRADGYTGHRCDSGGIGLDD